MSSFLSRRGAITGIVGAFVAMLKGVTGSPSQDPSVGAIAKRISDDARTTMYSYNTKTGELISCTVYDEHNRVIMQIDYWDRSDSRAAKGA